MSVSVIVRVPNHLGDCIMALPMVGETREAHAGSRVTVLVPEPLAELYRDNPAVDEILTVPREHVHGTIAVFKIRDLIAPRRFDLGYILPPSFGAAAGFKLGGVKQRIGYIADGRRLLLTKPLPLPTPLNATHRAETYFNLLRRGAGKELEFVRPKLFLSEADTDQADSILSGFGGSVADRFLVMAVRAVAESRRWGTANYLELAKTVIARHGVKVLLIGTEEDRREAETIAAAAGPGEVIDLCGKTTLREAAAILSRATAFVGNDSGPAHLAAAVGIPLVVLSGADDPAETSPISSRKTVLRRDELDCIACVRNTCPLKGEAHMRCMREISVEEVAAALAPSLAAA